MWNYDLVRLKSSTSRPAYSIGPSAHAASSVKTWWTKSSINSLTSWSVHAIPRHFLAASSPYAPCWVNLGPSIFFLLQLLLSRNNSIGKASYAGYPKPSLMRENQDWLAQNFRLPLLQLKASRDSGRASFSPPQWRRQKEALLAGCSRIKEATRHKGNIDSNSLFTSYITVL